MTPSSERSVAPSYQTDIANTPLPEILVTIHRYKAPGTLECRRDEEAKCFYFDQGEIIFATSNLIRDSLGDKLLNEGKITREQYDESVQLLRLTGKRQGVILAEMSVIEPRDLFVALREQIQEIVWSVFAWERGQVTFTPGRDKQLEFVKINVPVTSAVLQGVRRIPDARSLIARLGPKTTVFERTPNPVGEIKLSDDEQALLGLVDGRRILLDLVNSPPLPASENARLLYAFYALQLIGPRGQRQVKVQVKTEGGKYSGA